MSQNEGAADMKGLSESGQKKAEGSNAKQYRKKYQKKDDGKEVPPQDETSKSQNQPKETKTKAVADKATA